jgi:hypothetical protein
MELNDLNFRDMLYFGGAGAAVLLVFARLLVRL